MNYVTLALLKDIYDLPQQVHAYLFYDNYPNLTVLPGMHQEYSQYFGDLLFQEYL